MFIKPVIPTPDPYAGGYLPEAGRYVEPTPYWLRRIADGDVEEAEPPSDPPAVPQEQPAAAVLLAPPSSSP